MIKLKILYDCKILMDIIFGLIKSNPEYRYSINDQLIRSGLSVGSNISEANQRKGKDRDHLFTVALGSLEECRFQLFVYPGFNYNNKFNNVDDLLDKIKATIIKLKSLSSSPSSSSSPSKVFVS